MKNFYKYLGIVAIMLFSFYYTEKIAVLMRQKDPIYESIIVIAEDNKQEFTNAQIMEDTMIPGINGLTVNVDKSFQKMKSFGAFNKYYLIFDQVKPEISMEDYKDKIIKKGNSKKRSFAFIMEEKGEIAQYFSDNHLPLSILITEKTFMRDTTLEQINNDSQNYDATENLLNAQKENKNLCIINNFIESTCRKKSKYLIKPELELTAYNIAKIKSQLDSGSIILIKKSAKLEDVKLLLNEAKYKGLELTTLSKLITETNQETTK